MRNTEKSRQQAPSSFDEPNMDIGVYFAKKRPQKQKKVKINNIAKIVDKFLVVFLYLTEALS